MLVERGWKMRIRSCSFDWNNWSNRRKLSSELSSLGLKASPQKVNALLKQMGYSLQANVKTREGSQHPDRDAQFEHIKTIGTMNQVSAGLTAIPTSPAPSSQS